MAVEKSEILMSKGHTYVQCTLAILANTAILTYGLQLGWVSPATSYLQSETSPVSRPLTNTEITWLASLPPLIAIPSVIVSIYLVDAYGRKIMILIISAFEAACWILTIYPSNVTSLIIARICSGIATGGCFHVVPMYVKEISQASIVGPLGSLIILSQNLGVLVMYALGGYLDYDTVLWVVTPIPVVIFLVFLKAPESPAYLVKVGKIKEAIKTLSFLRGLEIDDIALLNEINEIKNEDDYFKSIPNISFITIFKNRAWRRGFIIMLMVSTAHGCNGTFAIVNHTSALLSSSGIAMNRELQSLFVPIFMTLGSCVTVVVVDKVGRKVLLSSTFLAIAFALMCLATTQLIQEHGGSPPGWLPVAAMTMALFSHSVAVAPVPYIIMLEMFNFQIRGKVMGIIVLNIFLSLFAQMFTLDLISTHFGTYSAFYYFGGVNLFGAAVVIFLLPETRGKRVEQIENELSGIRNMEDTNDHR